MNYPVFFIGLFIAVYGIETVGLLDTLARKVPDLTGGDQTVTALSILWVAAVASAIVDTIPFVATMIPMIDSMAATFGGPAELMAFPLMLLSILISTIYVYLRFFCARDDQPVIATTEIGTPVAFYWCTKAGIET